MTPSAFATTSAAKARCRIVRKAGEKPMAAPRTLMTQLSTPLAHLYADCEARRVRIRQEFESRWNARETLSARCQLADDSVVQIHDALFPQSHRARKGFSLRAVGGYSRRVLLSYFDLHILVLVVQH